MSRSFGSSFGFDQLPDSILNRNAGGLSPIVIKGEFDRVRKGESKHGKLLVIEHTVALILSSHALNLRPAFGLGVSERTGVLLFRRSAHPPLPSASRSSSLP